VSTGFRARYGPWALVAGASEGIGAEFARRLAQRGLDLLLVARRNEPLADLAASVREEANVEVACVPFDLAHLDAEALRDLVGEREVGLVVYNAAQSLIGRFLDQPLADKLRTIDVNCRGPLLMAHELGTAMARRGRGGIILMSSLAAFQGSPMIASYAATKAYDLVLAEGLWDELRTAGVDVLACCAGSTRTPNWDRSRPRATTRMMEPGTVVEEALAALGRRPSVIPGRFNRFVTFVLHRLLPRRRAIRIMGDATRRLYGLSEHE
jgi:short-subunit dehydrogenase